MLEPPLPPAFLQRMRRFLGDEFPAFAESLEGEPLAALRLNPAKISAEELAERRFFLEPLPWCPEEGFLLRAPAHAGQHPFHVAGCYYLQEPDAMAVVPLLSPQPGDLVLDLCAAPGGKATHIASRLQGQGVLLANDLVPARARTLAANLLRWGARNAAVTAEHPDRLARHFGAAFDRVLVDAPCSGEGMFRKSPEARLAWSPAHVTGCAARQRTILQTAARLVRPGGRLVYSTCTFAPEENEGVVGAFLRQHPEFHRASREDAQNGWRTPSYRRWKTCASACACGPTAPRQRGISSPSWRGRKGMKPPISPRGRFPLPEASPRRDGKRSSTKRWCACPLARCTRGARASTSCPRASRTCGACGLCRPACGWAISSGAASARPMPWPSPWTPGTPAPFWTSRWTTRAWKPTCKEEVSGLLGTMAGSWSVQRGTQWGGPAEREAG